MTALTASISALIGWMMLVWLTGLRAADKMKPAKT
jgi:hypothetical protein